MKILIVDDHSLFREGMSYVLEKLEPDVAILGAANYQQALTHLDQHPDIDLVLLDLDMPGKNGFESLVTLTEKHPTLPIVILSASNSRQDIQQAIHKGAAGYICKDTPSDTMLSALHLILSGVIYVPADFHHASAEPQQQLLTPRQRDVLALLVEGLSNKEIARRCELAEATVKMHVTAIFKSLNVNNRTQAAISAKQHGLL
ncbi:response regulator [Dasania marina]|uniref:response regulator n=1 Tax=Dasania marina TaxID=471499 RepID=UPI000475BDB3|nr:response regulator transcription factor [Dasania marina]